MDSDTIFALSSGRPPAAIAVVRVSGPHALEALRGLGCQPPIPRMLQLRSLLDPVTQYLLDEALVAYFPADQSVTGEDLVELHLHGSPATVAAVGQALATTSGARSAEPGEFTQRAFRNGKLDLVQVEGLSNLLRAETESQRRVALQASGGGISALIADWQQRLLALSAAVESAIDYSDADDVDVGMPNIQAMAEALVGELRLLLARPSAERVFDGVRVAIAGPPNAGKSTLINGLSQRSAAIVSSTSGTTRDLIEVPLRLGNTAFVLVDMAGLCDDTGDAIEALGIDLARGQIATADIVLWLGDDQPPSSDAIWVYPRTDLPGRQSPPPGRIPVSAKTGSGMAELIAGLQSAAAVLLPGEGETALTRRQMTIIDACAAALDDFIGEEDELIVAEHLRTCRSVLDHLTGKSGTEEMLSALFATFCIGK